MTFHYWLPWPTIWLGLPFDYVNNWVHGLFFFMEQINPFSSESHQLVTLIKHNIPAQQRKLMHISAPPSVENPLDTEAYTSYAPILIPPKIAF